MKNSWVGVLFATFLRLIFSKYSSLANGIEMMLQHASAVCLALTLAYYNVLVVSLCQA